MVKKMPNKNNGCTFGKITRTIVDNNTKLINEFKQEIREEFRELKELNNDLYNHLSTRLPIWVTVLFTILGSLTVGLIVHSLGY